MSETDGRLVKAKLTPDQAAAFDAIQRYHGLNGIDDTIRFLVKKEARIIHESSPLFTAPSPAAQEAQ